VTLSAQCHKCSRQFDLNDMYAADPCDADRCPKCAVNLGSAGLGHITFRIERHLKAFRRAVRELSENPGGFTVDTAALAACALEAVNQLDQPRALECSTRIVSAAR